MIFDVFFINFIMKIRKKLTGTLPSTPPFRAGSFNSSRFTVTSQ